MKILVDNEKFFLATMPPHRRTINTFIPGVEADHFNEIKFFLDLPATYFLIYCGSLFAFLGREYRGEDTVEGTPFMIGNTYTSGRVCMSGTDPKSKIDLINSYWFTQFNREKSFFAPICFDVSGEKLEVVNFKGWQDLCLKHRQFGHFFDYDSTSQSVPSRYMLSRLFADLQKGVCRISSKLSIDDFINSKTFLDEVFIDNDLFFIFRASLCPKNNLVTISGLLIIPMISLDDILGFVWKCVDAGLEVELHGFVFTDIKVTLQSIPNTRAHSGFRFSGQQSSPQNK